MKDKKYYLPMSVLTSETYEKLLSFIHRDKVIPPMNSFWDEIESLVVSLSPSFKKNLTIFTKGNLTQIEYQTALLVKLGIPPTKMAILLGKARGTVNSRRISLGNKIFGETVSFDVVDSKIRSF